MTTIECINLVKEVFLTGTAITGVYVAIQGLDTWKQQLKGQADYNLARSLLINTYKYRDALYFVRNPIMTGAELALTQEEKQGALTYNEESYRGNVKAYQKRWDAVLKCRNEISADIIEAEALWGKAMPKIIRNLINQEDELYRQINHFLAIKNPNLSNDEKDFDRKNFNRKFLYDSFDDTKDPFRLSFSEALLPIESYLRGKLHR